MKLLILSITIAVTAAGQLGNTYLPPVHHGQQQQQQQFRSAPIIPILKLQHENPGTGNYRFSFETANNIQQQESGQVKGTDLSAVQGSYSYAGADGQIYTVNYVADENGFRADGAHLPTPPPVSAEILQGLQQNAAEEAAGIFDDGQYRPGQHGEAEGQYVEKASHFHDFKTGAVSAGHHHFQQSGHFQQQPSSEYLPPHQKPGYRY